MEDKATFSISIEEYRGIKVSPKNVPLSLLDSYFKDLKQFIVGDSKEKDIVISFEKGSLITKIIASVIFISTLIGDVEAIQNGTIAPSNTRARYAKNLQSYAKKNSATISFGKKEMKKPLLITPKTEILKPVDIWTDFEDYTLGKIREMGGVSPNIHVVDENGNEIKVSSSEDVLGGFKENLLYTTKLIHFKAQKNLATGEIRDRILVSIEDFPKFDGSDFNERVNSATREWEGTDAKAFIDDLRGYNDAKEG